MEAVRQIGMDCQTLHDWVHQYNEAGVDCLVSGTASGRTVT